MYGNLIRRASGDAIQSLGLFSRVCQVAPTEQERAIAHGTAGSHHSYTIIFQIQCSGAAYTKASYQ